MSLYNIGMISQVSRKLNWTTRENKSIFNERILSSPFSEFTFRDTARMQRESETREQVWRSRELIDCADSLLTKRPGFDRRVMQSRVLQKIVLVNPMEVLLSIYQRWETWRELCNERIHRDKYSIDRWRQYSVNIRITVRLLYGVSILIELLCNALHVIITCCDRGPLSKVRVNTIRSEEAKGKLIAQSKSDKSNKT